MLVRVDHKLRIALSDLSSDVFNSIVEALSIPNIERQKAMEQNLWGWQRLSETIKLWTINRDSGDVPYLVMPRGFLPNLGQGLRAFDIEFKFEDNRYDEPTSTEWNHPIDLRPWQIEPVEKIALIQQGIWKAPPAAGKTVGVLEAIRRAKTPSIVLVHTKDILDQWVRRARQFLGPDFPVSTIGDGKVRVSDYLTVATVQTIHSRYDDLEKLGFFDEMFGFMCLDECHHATADTFNRVVNRFSSRIRIGMSATPDKTGDFELATKVLGPIFHETHRKEVESIIEPHIYRISTGFQFNYHRREDYPHLLKRLVTNHERNNLIVKTIMMNPGSHSLVVSKRLEHLDIIADLLVENGYQYQVLKLTGQEDTHTRKATIEFITKYPSIILSTLADEAIDIPRLDSIFLVFPQRNPGLIEQQVGRVCRAHPDKEYARVYDFADINVGPLENQWRIRRREVYQPHGWEVDIVSADDILAFPLDNNGNG